MSKEERKETRVERLARLLAESEATVRVKKTVIAQKEMQLQKELDELEYVEDQVYRLKEQINDLTENEDE